MSDELFLDDLIGNASIKTQLAIAVAAARLHNRAVPHILLTGKAGCGKTATSKAIARHGGSIFVEASAEGLRSAEDIAKVFSNFPLDGYDMSTGEAVTAIRPAILFVDEAHRLSLKSEELLGMAMENFRHTHITGRGKKRELVTSWVPRFTLICATTQEGKLSKPFRDRFKLSYVFNAYDYEESLDIIKLHAATRAIAIDDASVEAIARRSRGTPRLMVRFLERMHDYIAFLERDAVTLDVVEAQFTLMSIDYLGLTDTDTIILRGLHNSEGPVGLQTLSLLTNQDEKTIAEVNEPYLILLGFMERGRTGRSITEKGTDHLIQRGLIKPVLDTDTPALSCVLDRKKI